MKAFCKDSWREYLWTWALAKPFFSFFKNHLISQHYDSMFLMWKLSFGWYASYSATMQIDVCAHVCVSTCVPVCSFMRIHACVFAGTGGMQSKFKPVKDRSVVMAGKNQVIDKRHFMLYGVGRTRVQYFYLSFIGEWQKIAYAALPKKKTSINISTPIHHFFMEFKVAYMDTSPSILSSKQPCEIG